MKKLITILAATSMLAAPAFANDNYKYKTRAGASTGIETTHTGKAGVRSNSSVSAGDDIGNVRGQLNATNRVAYDNTYRNTDGQRQVMTSTGIETTHIGAAGVRANASVSPGDDIGNVRGQLQALHSLAPAAGLSTDAEINARTRY